MMRTTIIIFILIGMLFIFDFYTINFFEDEISYYNEQINQIIHLIQNEKHDEAQQEMNELDAHWNKKRIVWNMLCDHSESEAISILLNTSMSAMQHNNQFICTTALENLNLTIEFAGDRYSMLIDNIS